MDDGSHLGYLVYPIIAFVFIIIGGWFAGTEISLAKVSRIRIINYSEDGDKRAKKVLYIFEHFDKALTTLLIGNNIMHIGCASIMTLFAQKMWGDKAVTAVTFVTTLFVFFFSEMIPKAFAKACSEKFVLFSSGTLIFLMKIFTPVSFLFTRLSRLIELPLGVEEETEEPTVSEEELKEIIESIDETDEIDSETQDLVKNVMAFTERSVENAMIKQSQLVVLNTSMTQEKILEVHRSAGFSRYPVENNRGKLVGVLQMRSYLRELMNNGSANVSELMKKPVFVPKSISLDDLMRKMSASRIQMAFVKDESGNIIGAITMEDILEEIVGEIYDESDDESCDGSDAEGGDEINGESDDEGDEVTPC